MIASSGEASSSAAASGAAGASIKAVAGAINVRLSDLPGFRVGGNGGVSEGGDPGNQFKRCYGSLPNAGGDGPSFSSPDYVKSAGAGEVVSLVSGVSFPSRAALSRDSAEARNPRFPTCVADALAALTVAADGVKITGSQPHAVRLPDPVHQTSVVHPLLGMHASLTWTVRTVTLPVYLDLYLVAVGHEEITLFVWATMQPVVISSEGRLVSLMVQRALTEPY